MRIIAVTILREGSLGKITQRRDLTTHS